MSARFDLHSHSTASDGTLSPAEVVARAAQQGVVVLALTDHDTTAGLAEAASATHEHGVDLVPGVEISVTWGSLSVHVVGLRIDPGNQALQSGLARLRAFRDTRAVEIGRRLEVAGIPDALPGARALAHGGLVSRTHFARYLVAQGRASSVSAVFRKFLVRGRPGHVPGKWAALEEAVAWIRSAGGQAVLAHPARYRMSATRLRTLIAEFQAAGGAGIEVVSGSQDRSASQTLAGYAERFGLAASCGSDFHSPDGGYAELGRMADMPVTCRPIWEQW